MITNVCTSRSLIPHVVLDFSSDFLVLQDMGLLDVALCCSDDRNYFLSSVLPRFFSSMRVESTRRVCSNNYILWLSKRGLSTKRLSLDMSVKDEPLKLISSSCKNLETLHVLGNSYLTHSGVSSILGQSQFLREFKLIKVSSPAHTDESIENCLHIIAGNCPKLETLVLQTRDQGEDYSGLIPIAKKCLYLRHLNLDGCMGIDDSIINQLADTFSQLQSLVTTTTTTTSRRGERSIPIGLTSLNLNECLISQNALVNICRSCPQLKHVNLFTAYETTNEAILVIVESCQELESVSFGEYYHTLNNRDETVQHIMNNCPNLKCLSAPEHVLTNAALANIDTLSQLTSLDIVLEAFRDISFVLPNLHTLKTYPVDAATQDKDSIVAGVLQRCPNLTTLHLRNVSVVSILAVSLHCSQLKCIKLSDINVSNNIFVTDIGVFSLVTGCAKLTSISLSGCNVITDLAVSTIAQKLPMLEYIDLFYCRKVTDFGITSLITHCKKLQKLGVSLESISVDTKKALSKRGIVRF